MTTFTQEYLSLNSDYSQVLSAQKDLLMSIYHSLHYYSQVQNCMTGVTREYFQLIMLLLASTKLHDRSYSRVFSTHQ